MTRRSGIVAVIVAVAALGVVGSAMARTREDAPTDDEDNNYDPFSDVEQEFTSFTDLYDTITGADMNFKVNEYPKYATAIREAEQRWNIPPDQLAKQLFVESGYRADVIAGTKRSPVGAIGIGQFMPDAAKDYGLILADGTDMRTNPFASIEAAAHYMHDLYAQFGDWRSALMAYNWGPGNVAKYNQNQDVTVPLETSQYVQKILA